MKSFFTLSLVLLSIYNYAQKLDYKTLKSFIGNRVVELEEYYGIQSSSIEDNFGNQKASYSDIEIAPYEINMVVETEGKNIKKITVINSKNRTSFFQNFAEEIQLASPVKKNYKTYYISLVKNSTKKKMYQESINQLVELLKKPTTDLSQNHGLLEANSLNATITIDHTSSILTIN
ncbi:hypothetical protein [Empedobacter brevis]|uniref:hypothetical protein n=1 Tax=Empedobacter brevis TaxID=247 RepID=UPI002896556B|nr:hypothetical protein [Empedobacter brevis]